MSAMHMHVGCICPCLHPPSDVGLPLRLNCASQRLVGKVWWTPRYLDVYVRPVPLLLPLVCCRSVLCDEALGAGAASSAGRCTHNTHTRQREGRGSSSAQGRDGMPCPCKVPFPCRRSLPHPGRLTRAAGMGTMGSCGPAPAPVSCIVRQSGTSTPASARYRMSSG